MAHPLISEVDTHGKEALEHLEKELGTLRTGRAHPSLVENIMVESYGSKAPLKTIATISAQDNTSIVIQPWDKSVLTAIEKALQEASLGSQPVSDGHTIRLAMPTPTEEQRKELCKKAQQMAEQARISVRTTRSDAHSKLRKLKEASEITEDDFYQYEKEMQKVVDTLNDTIETRVTAKEKDIMTV